MKKCTTKLSALLFAAALAISSQPSDVLAKDYRLEDTYKVGDIIDVNTAWIGDLDIDIPDSVEQIEEDKVAVERIAVRKGAADTTALITDALQAVNVEGDPEEPTDPEEPETPASTIYYGTMNGYLSATDDYLLYPAELTLGDYLQAKLTLPNNAQIDYDLLLFNSSLSLIKSSDYITYMNAAGTIEESIGYLATTNEKVYVCVYSVGGGSTTEAYTLNYSITTNFTDSDEPNENAKEANALDLGETGTKVTGKLNSPIDNDWYSFTVLDDPSYYKMRFSVSSSSTTNGCKFELYRNLGNATYFGMQYLGSGTGGEVEVPAGEYYLRVVSTNTFENFDASDIPAYDLSVAQVSRVDKITLTEIAASDAITVNYGKGNYKRVDQTHTQLVALKGSAYYYVNGYPKEAVNARIYGEVEDQQWKEIHRPDMAYVYGSAITNSGGSFKIYIDLNTALGGLKYAAPVSTHHYDFMKATVYPENNDKNTSISYFYYLKYCDLY